VILVLVYISAPKPFSNLTVQVYSPESAESTKVSRLLDNVYSVSDFISGLVGGATIVPSGPFHAIVIDSGAFTNELTSTVQVKVGGCP
jgi:hypothetical protein